MDELNAVWKDQADFNSNFFPKPDGFEERSRQTKEFILHMVSELDELLRAISWKVHRKDAPKPNVEHIRDEITDLLKYLFSIMLVWEVSPDQMLADYWRKSAVCRQRYSEEYVKSLDRPAVICDIDGVLADYYLGFLTWVMSRYSVTSAECKALLQTRVWLDHESLGIDPQRWQEIKHCFRTERGKLSLPPFPDARNFLEWVRSEGYLIVLLTSRPINQYPNIYTETLEWLTSCKLPFDFIWWATDKREKVLESGLNHQAKFAVEDDPKYALQFANSGIRTYLVRRGMTDEVPSHPNLTVVSDLKEIQDYGTV